MVLLVRHGETEWSRAHKHTGRTDIPLTDAGREAARDLGERLHDRAFTEVLTSPLVRAAETCRLALPDADPLVRDDLREWDYGEYEGRTTTEIREERPDWYLWHDGCPGGESAEDVGRRADRIIEELAGLDRDVAVVAHGHLLRVLTARWLGLPPASGGLFALSTASLSELGHERETRVIRLWNDTSHLTP
jgi:probable phosphoglycerate mutase